MANELTNSQKFKIWRTNFGRQRRLFSGKILRYLNNSLFLLNRAQAKKLIKLKSKNIEDYKTWSIYAILLPICAYSFAFLVNVLLLVNQPASVTSLELFQTLNNGSLPIIAFGIISSCISYLMEYIEEAADQRLIWYLRRKLMAIAVLFLFLTSAIYILQSINRKFIVISAMEEILIFGATIIVLIFAVSTGRKMFLLQRNTIQEDFADQITKGKKNFAQGLNVQFGEDEN